MWAEEALLADCLTTLAEVLREWVLLKVQDQDRDLPAVDELDLTALYAR